MPLKRFSIRDILFAATLVAVLLGWWIDSHHVTASPGRYQMQIVNGSGMMLDTATGEVWYQTQAEFNQRKIGK